MVIRRSEEDRIWTVPNVICLLRAVGIGPLLWTASHGYRQIFLWLMISLLLSDWLDGKLATMLDQRTTLGSRLDSVADALMYAAIALSFWWLERETIREQLGWILIVLGTWLLSTAVGLIRFHRLPSYHTWAAKISWFATACAALYLLLAGNPTLLPWALGLVVFTNLHAVAVGLALPRWESDVWSLREAWRMRRSGP